MAFTYACLAAAVVALWLGGDEHAPAWRRWLWLGLLVVATMAGMIGGYVRPLGLLWIGALGAATSAFAQPGRTPVIRGLLATAIIVLAAGLMAHRLPGFANPPVITDARFTPDALPFSLYLNFDKTLIGLFILGFCHARIARGAEGATLARRAAPVAAGTIIVVLLLSLALGYVHFAPKLPPEAALWLGVNLLFTCVAEEALFRGFVQAQLTRVWQHRAGGRWLALIVGAGLFGVAHFAGGAMYVGLATVAGLGYGWAYLRAGNRIEAAILTHFALNTLHFFFFTYPALADRG